METTPEEKKGKGTLWIILLLASVAFNIYQWVHQNTTINMYESKVDTLVIERVNVEKELSETKSELSKYQGISANLDSLLNEANGKIDVMEKNIRTITRNERNAAELNKKLKEQ